MSQRRHAGVKEAGASQVLDPHLFCSDEKLAWLPDAGPWSHLGDHPLLMPSCPWQVLHPGLLAQVQMDLLLMKMGSRVLALLPGVKWLSLPEIVEEFEKLMVHQVKSPSLNCKSHVT